MSRPHLHPRALYAEPPAVAADAATEFGASVRAEDLLYVQVNVGDGDCQVLVLPRVDGSRKVLVADTPNGDKTIELIESLRSCADEDGQPLVELDGNFYVVATHPHRDHIGGLNKVLETYRDHVAEYWDCGYRYTGADYQRLVNEVDDLQRLGPGSATVSYPAAGTTRFIDDVRITTLAPAVRLRNRFDTWGVEVNDASLVLKVEFPVSWMPVVNPDADVRRKAKIILGGDAQTHSWGQVMHDFPQLHAHESPVVDALRDTVEATEPLRAHLFKVPHHASKHGVNLELVERVKPKISIVSSKGDRPNYFFPHDVAQESIREALQRVAANHKSPRQRDWALGLLYTADTMAGPADAFAADLDDFSDVEQAETDMGAIDKPEPPDAANATDLGSIACAVRPTGAMRLWRFQDEPGDDVDLEKALRYLGPGVVRT